jgi:hypothetical protein
MQNELQDGKLLRTSRANWEKTVPKIRVGLTSQLSSGRLSSRLSQKLLRIFDRVPGITLMPKSYPIDPCTERRLLLFKINEYALCLGTDTRVHHANK